MRSECADIHGSMVVLTLRWGKQDLNSRSPGLVPLRADRIARETARPKGAPFTAQPKVRILFVPAESPCLAQTRPLHVEHSGSSRG
jgi:hypothetical protein